MCVSILRNSQNKILAGILENKIIFILEILIIFYYFGILFLNKNLNIAFTICPYFLFAIFLYIMFYLGDIGNYGVKESVHFISIFIAALPICIVVFSLWVKNTLIICKGSTLKIEENLNSKIAEIQRVIEEKEKDKLESNEGVDKEFSLKIIKPVEEIYRKYCINQILNINKNLVEFKNENFKFSLGNFCKFLFRKNIKSLVNS